MPEAAPVRRDGDGEPVSETQQCRQIAFQYNIIFEINWQNDLAFLNTIKKYPRSMRENKLLRSYDLMFVKYIILALDV